MRRNSSEISNSGNSNVNVNVNVDTSSLAYAMMCYWHSSGMITDEQFSHMITNFSSLLNKEDAILPQLLSNKEYSPYLVRQKNNINTLKTFIPPFFNR
ncbi:hypothetical protein ACIGHG_04190 [Bacillus sp. NPDC077411]|uniref:Uncharacterized protein n=1 Tax=Bacillus bruguierae TaxID=3127667 RepID=A0ABU8FKE3_9BACI|nr:hypothetical protein SAMN04488574_103270 [Bacillus sp. 71mf]SFS46383.1 hypothetical protein SAMN04488145_101632 [Bacillus sp. 103mf]